MTIGGTQNSSRVKQWLTVGTNTGGAGKILYAFRDQQCTVVCNNISLQSKNKGTNTDSTGEK